MVGILYAVSLAATSLAIAVAGSIAGHTLAVDAVAAMLGSCAASLLRFSLLRGWAFRPPVGGPAARPARRRRAMTAAGPDLIEAPAAQRVRSGRPDPADPTFPPPRRSTARTAVADRCRPLLRPAGYFVASRAVVLAVAVAVAALHPKVRIVQTLGTIFDGHWYLEIAQHGYPHRLVNEGDGSRWRLPRVPGGGQGPGRDHTPEPADGGGRGGLRVRAHRGAGHLAGGTRSVRGAAGRPRRAARGLLPHGLRALARLHGGAVPDGRGGVPLRLVTALLADRRPLCCLAGLSRDAGVVVIAVLVLAAVPAAWRGRSWRPAVAAAVAPLGLVGFMAYGWSMVGTPVAFLASERFWQGQHFVWFRTPAVAIEAALRQGPTDRPSCPTRSPEPHSSWDSSGSGGSTR